MLKLYIKHIRMVNTKALERYVKSDIGDDDWNPLTWNQQADDNSPNKDTVINALNIVISKCFGGGVFQLGANKFFIETGSAPFSDSPLSTIRGYFYSIRPGMGHILLNVNACTSAFLQPVTLDELMSVKNQKLFGKDYPSFLNGLRVYIDYTRGRTDKAKQSDMNKDESRIKKISGLGLSCEKQMFSYKKRDPNGQVESEKQIDVATYLHTSK
jgi:eukaryotic translation initiation factor 2C